MKLLSVILVTFSLMFPPASRAHGDEYSFVKNFELLGITVLGSVAHITVRHKKSKSPVRFELIPGDLCLESKPPQCSGVIIRLDNPSYRGTEDVESTFSADLHNLYGSAGGVIVSLAGPNKVLTIRY